jgi:diguanylate cyclase (GGDEF)-like protein
MRDVSGREIGDMIIINDLGKEKSEFLHFIGQNIFIGLSLIGLILTLIHVILRRTDKNILFQQKTLRESEERLNEAQHFAHIGSWTLEIKSGELVWSNEVFRIFEIDSSRFGATYEAFLNAIHPDDRELVNHAYTHSLEARIPYEISHRLLFGDGRIKWVHEKGKSEFDAEGNPIRSIGTVQDITDRKLSEEKINVLAFFDQLTGLPNRTLLIDRLKQAKSSSARNSNFGALLFIDLDNFKTLNDTLGHDVGDMLLKQVAQRLSNCVREEDTVSRFGGDEFVVVLLGLNSDKTEAATASEVIAEKILASLNKSYLLNGVNHRSSASIGVTLFQGAGTSIDDLMKQADLAMYKSKDEGRNGIRFFDPDMESAIKQRIALEEDLRRGILENQFVLYYQPQVLDDGRITGTEALVRWNHPLRGIVPPMEFIPIAEETGIILPLGNWILKTACSQLTLWEKIPEMETITMAVNVSARQFSQNDFVSQVLSIMTETGANPQRLKLELTESLLVQNVEEVIEKMVALKAAGVGFSLDDFGTGYSSLSYLKRLPLDQLKIDRSFVRDILVDANDAIICKSTIALAESMGLAVIAEGVETDEQRNALFRLGCHSYQGYWFSRPLPINEFEIFCLQSAGNNK